MKSWFQIQIKLKLKLFNEEAVCQCKLPAWDTLELTEQMDLNHNTMFLQSFYILDFPINVTKSI